MLLWTYESMATIFTNGAALFILAGMLANTSLYIRRGRPEDRLFLALIIMDMTAAFFSSASMWLFETGVPLPTLLYTLIFTVRYSVYAVFSAFVVTCIVTYTVLFRNCVTRSRDLITIACLTAKGDLADGTIFLAGDDAFPGKNIMDLQYAPAFIGDLSDMMEGDPDFVLAVMEGTSYEEHTLYLDKGDILYLYTDGVTEAMNEENKLYGENRLKELLSFGDSCPEPDDITMLCIRCLGN